MLIRLRRLRLAPEERGRDQYPRHEDGELHQRARDLRVHRAAANKARRVKTRTISRRYSGVREEVVNGLAVRAAASAISAANSSMEPAEDSRSHTSPETRSGAGFTPVIATRACDTFPFCCNATAMPASG